MFVHFIWLFVFIVLKNHFENCYSVAVWLQSFSSVSAINPLAAFYDIRDKKGEIWLLVDFTFKNGN
jgi:hypothetical protein